MSLINENFLKLQDSYLFSTIAKKVAKFTEENPEKEIIKLGIGDVTRPIVPACIEAMHKAVDEIGTKEGFKGYGPEQGYDFLRDAIVKNDYKSRGIDVKKDEIFVSDGAKCDCGNIVDIFGKENKVAITDPVYPVYLDTNIMSGRDVIYLPVTAKNNFMPELPKEKVDMIYLCFPNNPTGTVLTKEELKKWVDYAKANNSVILYDAAYEAFITEEKIPHSIYEVEGAKEVAIEFKSYSKTAGFTGTRCGYTVIPRELIRGGMNLNQMWVRNRTTKTNGVSYVIQKGAEAVFSEEGQKQIRENIRIYKENAACLMDALDRLGIWYCGGKNAPYIWMKCPDSMGSWEFFDYLLRELQIVGTPGAGFGACGEGYFRFSTFGSPEDTREAARRLLSAEKLKKK